MDRKPDVYCMARVTFGDTPSPFLLFAIIQKHAKGHEGTQRQLMK